MATPEPTARPQTPDEKADQQYAELLQELRVAQTGVQFLFAFLLTLTFTQRFDAITPFQEKLYIGVLITTALSTALLIGPVPFHRTVWRRGLKPHLVRGADVMARLGLLLLLASINGAVLLVLDVVMTGMLPFVLSALVLLWFVGVWYAIPLTARERNAE